MATLGQPIPHSRHRGTQLYFRVMAELIHAAQYRGVTTYQDVAQIMGLPMSGNNMGAEVGHMLGEISEDEVRAGRPMLSSVVVGVSGKPGKGFPEWAKKVGRLTANQDEDAFWRAERDATYEAWRRPLPRS